MAICEVCSTPFKPKPNTKGKYCSRPCTVEGDRITKPAAVRTTYYANPRACKQCNGVVPYEKRHNTFCSQSCAATHTNIERRRTGWQMSQDTKSAMSSTAKSKHVPWTRVSFDACEVCGCPHVSRGSPRRFRRSRFCSSTCLSTHRSTVARNNPGLGTRRSKDEITLYSLCATHFVNVTHNEKLVDGWDADIVIHDTKTAVLWNGPWHYREMNFGNHSLSQVQNRDAIKIKEFETAGWRVLVFEDRTFTPHTAFEQIVGGTGGI